MSYQFHINEFEGPTQYAGLIWDLEQRIRRSAHRPANKQVLIDRMMAELYTGYAGGDDFATFEATFLAALDNPNKGPAVNAAFIYFSAP